MIATRYGTADKSMRSSALLAHSQRLERALGPFLAIVGVAVGAVLLVAIGHALGLLISTTDSAAPAGLYRLVSANFQRGELVAACLPIAIAKDGLARGYLCPGTCAGEAEAVGKIVGALPGDFIEIEPQWIAVNGVRFKGSAVATRDSAGRSLTHVAWGTHRVGAGEVWLFGFNDLRSWDSRYFGPVPLVNVRGAIKPLVTW